MDVPDTGKLNSANHITDELRLRFPNPCRALEICFDPDCWDKMDLRLRHEENV